MDPETVQWCKHCYWEKVCRCNGWEKLVYKKGDKIMSLYCDCTKETCGYCCSESTFERTVARQIYCQPGCTEKK